MQILEMPKTHCLWDISTMWRKALLPGLSFMEHGWSIGHAGGNAKNISTTLCCPETPFVFSWWVP
jgi:hypothetical protein